MEKGKSEILSNSTVLKEEEELAMETLKSQRVKRKRTGITVDKGMEYFEKKGIMSKETPLTIKFRRMNTILILNIYYGNWIIN